MSKNRKKISSKSSEYIKIGGYKIARRKKSNTSNEFDFYITYRDIDRKFWDDIYQAFDTLYPGDSFDMFLRRWDNWYAELIKISKDIQSSPHSEKDYRVVNSLRYEISGYPCPWKDVVREEYPERLSKFDLEERWKFIQTLKPPTKNISYAKRIVVRDLIKREYRDKCKYANVYSILLLKKTYFTWLKQNAGQTTSINQVCLSISVDKIVDKISKVDYNEFVFCGSIPFFVLSNLYLRDLERKIADREKKNPVRYTLIVLYPSLENIKALSILRKEAIDDLFKDILITYISLFEKMLFLRDKGVYVRVLYVDDLLPYDIYLLDKQICLIPFGSGIHQPGLGHSKGTDMSSSTETLLYIDEYPLIHKFMIQVYDTWFGGLIRHHLNRFICTSSFSTELCKTLRQAQKLILYKNDNCSGLIDELENKVNELTDRIVTQSSGEHGYLPPKNHPFRHDYRLLFKDCEEYHHYGSLINGYAEWSERGRYLDQRIAYELKRLYNPDL